MIEVANMSGAGSPAVSRIVVSDLGSAVSASQGGRNTAGDCNLGMKTAYLRDSGFRALRQFPVFTEENTVSDAGYPAPFGCAFIKLEDSQ